MMVGRREPGRWSGGTRSVEEHRQVYDWDGAVLPACAEISELLEGHHEDIARAFWEHFLDMARVAAHRHPELVREVITISSPFAGPPTCTNVWRPFEWLTGEKIDDPALNARLEEAAQPLPVPATAIWSHSDGLVNGLICREPEGSEGRAIEVSSSHLWVQMKPDVLRAVAQVLGGQSGSEAR